jgi:hypothetical protein
MSLNFKEIVAALFAVLAAQGSYVGAIVALIARYVMPLIQPHEKMTFADDERNTASGAPDEFKKAVRDYLTQLIARVKNTLVRNLAESIVLSVSDAILDAVYAIIVGNDPAPKPADVSAEFAPAALAEVHTVAEQHGAKLSV